MHNASELFCVWEYNVFLSKSGPYNIFSSVWSKLFQYSSLLTNLKFDVVIVVAVLKLSSWQVWRTLSDTNMIIRCSLGAHHTVYHFHKCIIRFVDTTIDLDQEQILNSVHFDPRRTRAIFDIFCNGVLIPHLHVWSAFVTFNDT